MGCVRDVGRDKVLRRFCVDRLEEVGLARGIAFGGEFSRRWDMFSFDRYPDAIRRNAIMPTCCRELSNAFLCATWRRHALLWHTLDEQHSFLGGLLMGTKLFQSDATPISRDSSAYCSIDHDDDSVQVLPQRYKHFQRIFISLFFAGALLR